MRWKFWTKKPKQDAAQHLLQATFNLNMAIRHVMLDTGCRVDVSVCMIDNSLYPGGSYPAVSMAVWRSKK